MHSRAEHPSLFFRAHLGVECLESRRFLSASQLDDSGGSQIDIGIFPVFLDQTDPVAVTSLHTTDRARTNNQGNSAEGHNGPLPVIPYDDSIDPVSNCPGLDPKFCLPGDADASGAVDFLDFLVLAQNFGMENATWSDGDFNDDGRVTFQDFLVLMHHFGAVA